MAVRASWMRGAGAGLMSGRADLRTAAVAAIGITSIKGKKSITTTKAAASPTTC